MFSGAFHCCMYISKGTVSTYRACHDQMAYRSIWRDCVQAWVQYHLRPLHQENQLKNIIARRFRLQLILQLES